MNHEEVRMTLKDILGEYLHDLAGVDTCDCMKVAGMIYSCQERTSEIVMSYYKSARRTVDAAYAAEICSDEDFFRDFTVSRGAYRLMENAVAPIKGNEPWNRQSHRKADDALQEVASELCTALDVMFGESDYYIHDVVGEAYSRFSDYIEEMAEKPVVPKRLEYFPWERWNTDWWDEQSGRKRHERIKETGIKWYDYMEEEKYAVYRDACLWA